MGFKIILSATSPNILGNLLPSAAAAVPFDISPSTDISKAKHPQWRQQLSIHSSQVHLTDLHKSHKLRRDLDWNRNTMDASSLLKQSKENILNRLTPHSLYITYCMSQIGKHSLASFLNIKNQFAGFLMFFHLFFFSFFFTRTLFQPMRLISFTHLVPLFPLSEIHTTTPTLNL